MHIFLRVQTASQKDPTISILRGLDGEVKLGGWLKNEDR